MARLVFLCVLLAAGSAGARRRDPAGFSGHVPARLRVMPVPLPSGELHIQATNLGEQVHTNIFNLDGTFDAEALRALDRLWRCKRTGHQRSVDPHLLQILSHVYDKYGRVIKLVSGYRDQENTHSFHYQGAAADIRVPGVSIRALRRFVESLDHGGMGVGLYPKSNFVHVDVRPSPSYRWVDTGGPRQRPRVSVRSTDRPNS